MSLNFILEKTHKKIPEEDLELHWRTGASSKQL